MSVQASTNFDHIYLAFDIHDVLALPEADDRSAPLFQTYGMLLQLPVEGYPKLIRHYVYPFAKELFQLLAQTPGVHFSFFTSSKEIFAIPFVNQFLIKSLGEEGYAKIAEKVRVCAREQLKPDKCYRDVSRSRHSTYGNNRKDLDVVFPERDISPGQRILIDDDRSFAAPDQAKNLVCISGHNWTEKFRSYQSYGYSLSIFASFEELEQTESMKNPEMSTALYLKTSAGEEVPEHYVVVYFDAEEKKELELSAEESAKIKELHTKSKLESSVDFSFNNPFTSIKKAIVEEIIKTCFQNSSGFSSRTYIYIYGEGVKAEKCMKSASKGEIAIHLREGGAQIYFPQNPDLAISLSSHGKLVQLAVELWEKEWRNNNFFFKESEKSFAKAQLYDLVWDKVKNLVWKERFIPEANHILLLTGAIFAAWEESKATQKPLNKILFNWQCDVEDEKKKFDARILPKRSELYQKGLELLRQVKPDIKPITIKSFDTAQELNPTLPDDGAEENKGDCVIS